MFKFDFKKLQKGSENLDAREKSILNWINNTVAVLYYISFILLTGGAVYIVATSEVPFLYAFVFWMMLWIALMVIRTGMMMVSVVLAMFFARN